MERTNTTTSQRHGFICLSVRKARDLISKQHPLTDDNGKVVVEQDEDGNSHVVPDARYKFQIGHISM